MPLKPVLGLLVLVGLAAAMSVGSFGYWLVTPNNHRAALVNVAVPDLASTLCLGRGTSISYGLRVDFKLEWVTQDDLFAVVNRLTRQGWQPITQMTTNIALLPPRRT